MKTFTKNELIREGFLPSASRTKLSVPFQPVDVCPFSLYERLPEDIKSNYKIDTSCGIELAYLKGSLAEKLLEKAKKEGRI